jgi:hypothetical protein
MQRNSKFDSEVPLSKKQRNILTAEFTLDTYGDDEGMSSLKHYVCLTQV